MDVPVGLGRTHPRLDLYRRAFDITVSAVLLLIMLPVIIVAAIGSAVSLRAWPFFTHQRVGRGGELFRFVKIRTLPRDVGQYVDKHKLDRSRIPPFCNLLRRFHLDELPQLLHVLRGNMSLVGPRPEMAMLHHEMPASFAAERTAVRPGCTGLWQVSEACVDLIGAAPQYDRFYLAHRTLRFDLWVLGRTALKMTGLSRGVPLEKVPTWVVPTKRVADVYVLDLGGGHAEAPVAIPALAGR